MTSLKSDRPMKFNEPAPVDRGWAWMIVLAAFMHLFILIGLARSSGMIFVELIQKYHGTASSTSLIVSLQTGISLFLAPVFTAAAEIFTCRVVCIVGSIIYSSAFIISSFLDSLQQIVWCYGILAGIGYGCCLTPAPVIVGRYFDKKRALANGLAFSGTGLGSIMLPLLVYVLMDKYYLHGAMLVLGAFVLQTTIFASFYRPLFLYQTKVVPSHVENLLQQPDDSKILRLHLSSEDKNDHMDQNDAAAIENSEDMFYTPRDVERFEDQRSTYRTQKSEDPSQWSGGASSRYESAFDLAMLSSLQDIPWTLGPVPEESTIDNVTTDDENVISQNRGFWQIWKSKIRIMLLRICYIKNEQGVMTALFSTDLLKDYEFLWALIGVVLFLNAFFLSLVVPPHCADLNFDKADAARMLSIQGSADMCGRLFTAATGDRKFFKRNRRQAFCLYTIVVSLLIFILACVKIFYVFSGVLACCAFLFGAFVAINPVVVTDIVGVHNLAKAWGLQLFSEGFVLTLSPVIIGALKDYTGSYVAGLCYLGILTSMASVCILISTVLWFRKTKRCVK